MKVLHVYKTYLPENFTGVPRVIHALSEESNALGVENHVLALYEQPEQVPAQIGRHHVHAAKRNFELASTSMSISAFAKFQALARMVDIIHYHFPWPVADLLHLIHGGGKPAIVTYHSDIIKQRLLLRLYEPLMHRFLSGMGAIVATSPNYVETSPVLARYRDKVSVIPIGIAERTPPETVLLQSWRERLGEGFFLFIGALRYYKGVTFLIKAAQATGLPVVIAGDNLQNDLDITRLPANVVYVGEVSDTDKEALLTLCSAFVFPSHLRSEAFGVALVEAARAGKPLISCEIGTGTSYVNLEGETGLVIPPANADALAHAMRMLSGERAMLEQMGAKARQRYEQLFVADRMRAAYLSLYERLVSVLVR